MTLRDALLEASTRIARRDAEMLLVHGLQRDRAWLLAHSEDELAATAHEDLRAVTARRAAEEPLQYILGSAEFYGLRLRVTPDVLIPRPETEHLVEETLAWARTLTQPLRIADVGTGSGAIALALAAHLPEAKITAVDLSTAALGVARANAETLGLAERIRFLEGDLLDPLLTDEVELDAVVSNPPYVPERDAAILAREVREYEPAMALFAGEEGMDVYCRLIPQAWRALCGGGLLAMEIGFGQREAIRELLTGWNAVRFVEDYAGIPRVVLAKKPRRKC